MKLVAGAACTGIASYQQLAMDGTASTMANIHEGQTVSTVFIADA